MNSCVYSSFRFSEFEGHRVSRISGSADCLDFWCSLNWGFPVFWNVGFSLPRRFSKGWVTTFGKQRTWQTEVKSRSATQMSQLVWAQWISILCGAFRFPATSVQRCLVACKEEGVRLPLAISLRCGLVFFRLQRIPFRWPLTEGAITDGPFFSKRWPLIASIGTHKTKFTFWQRPTIFDFLIKRVAREKPNRYPRIPIWFSLATLLIKKSNIWPAVSS